MPSLRRFLSLPSLEASRIVRHSTSLPNTVCQPQSKQFRRHCPTRLLKTSHGNCSITSPNPPALCRAKSDNFDEREVMSGGWSVPDWYPAEVELNACRERAFVRPLSTKETKAAVQSLDVENSVVYRELRESIWRSEAPTSFFKTVGSSIDSEGGGSTTDFGGKMKKKLDSCSIIDVKGRPVKLERKPCKVKREAAAGCQVKQQQHTVIGKFRSNLQRNDGLREGLLCEVGDSVGSAFASLIFMMKALQQHTFWLRRILMGDADNRLQDVVGKVHAEMQESFLWLFQQVFSCTPKLMLLTMMLLADFTVHSMGKHVALAVIPMGDPPTASVVSIESGSRRAIVEGLSLRERSAIRISLNEGQESLYETSLSEGGEGNGVVRNVKVGGGMGGQSMPTKLAESRAPMTVEDETGGGVNDASLLGYPTLLGGGGGGGGADTKEDQMLSIMWEAVSKELDSRPDNPYIMDAKTKLMLVAPVRAPLLEADDYPCYDRTDLIYQHEISMDPGNPLLLANYAQFLYLVRHDHSRAEELFKRAMRADPVDGEVMGRFASFLWVAKGDVEEADWAYKAAVEADPTNSYQAGCYAHFLWNSSAGQEDTPTTPTCPPHLHVATS